MQKANQHISAFNRFSAIVLTALLLVSSVGISVTLHMCKDEVMNISLMGEAQQCGPVDYDCTTQHTEEGFAKAPCCSDQSVTSLSCFFDDAIFLSINNPDHPFVSNFTADTKPVVSNYTAYRVDVRPPPVISSDLQIAFQSFLI